MTSLLGCQMDIPDLPSPIPPKCFCWPSSSLKRTIPVAQVKQPLEVILDSSLPLMSYIQYLLNHVGLPSKYIRTQCSVSLLLTWSKPWPSLTRIIAGASYLVSLSLLSSLPSTQITKENLLKPFKAQVRSNYSFAQNPPVANFWDFPGRPVVKTPQSQWRGCGFNLRLGN